MSVKLSCGAQQYAWGKVGEASSVYRFVKAADPTAQLSEHEPAAELWMGTHPKCPSRLPDGASLAEHLAAHPQALGPAVAERFGGLPFLFKVLSVNKALSASLPTAKRLPPPR